LRFGDPLFLAHLFLAGESGRWDGLIPDGQLHTAMEHRLFVEMVEFAKLRNGDFVFFGDGPEAVSVFDGIVEGLFLRGACCRWSLDRRARFHHELHSALERLARLQMIEFTQFGNRDLVLFGNFPKGVSMFDGVIFSRYLSLFGDAFFLRCFLLGGSGGTVTDSGDFQLLPGVDHVGWLDAVEAHQVFEGGMVFPSDGEEGVSRLYGIEPAGLLFCLFILCGDFCRVLRALARFYGFAKFEDLPDADQGTLFEAVGFPERLSADPMGMGDGGEGVSRADFVSLVRCGSGTELLFFSTFGVFRRGGFSRGFLFVLKRYGGGNAKLLSRVDQRARLQIIGFKEGLQGKVKFVGDSGEGIPGLYRVIFFTYLYGRGSPIGVQPGRYSS